MWLDNTSGLTLHILEIRSSQVRSGGTITHPEIAEMAISEIYAKYYKVVLDGSTYRNGAEEKLVKLYRSIIKFISNKDGISFKLYIAVLTGLHSVKRQKGA